MELSLLSCGGVTYVSGSSLGYPSDPDTNILSSFNLFQSVPLLFSLSFIHYYSVITSSQYLVSSIVLGVSYLLSELTSITSFSSAFSTKKFPLCFLSVSFLFLSALFLDSLFSFYLRETSSFIFEYCFIIQHYQLFLSIAAAEHVSVPKLSQVPLIDLCWLRRRENQRAFTANTCKHHTQNTAPSTMTEVEA